MDGVRAGGDHGKRRREDRGGTDASDDLAQPQHQHPGPGRTAGSRGEDREELPEGEQDGSPDQEALAPEQVTHDPEGEFEERDRDEERVGDPG